MTETAAPPGAWNFVKDDQKNTIEAHLTLDLAADAVANRRQLYHDYLGAVRTLRYLAQKAIKAGDEPDLMQAALNRHFENLERLQKLLIDPLFRQDLSHD